MTQTYRTTSGHSFTSLPIETVTAFTDADVDYINPQQVVTALNGERFTILEVRHVQGRLYRIVMLPA